MKKMQLVIRCDYGGETTGWGHVVRCSALTALALKHDMHTVLVTRAKQGGLTAEVETTFKETVFVPDENGFFSWIKSRQNESLAVVVDSHDYTPEDILHLRHTVLNAAQPLYILTDFPPATGIDFSGVTFVYGGVYAEMIRSTLTNNNVLTGLAYTLIRNDFNTALLNHQSQPNSQSNHAPKKCVIMMGGIDYAQATPKALEYLYKALGKDVWPIVIHRKQGGAVVQAIEKNLKNFTHHTWLENLGTTEVAQRFLEPDFAITACGGTIHEMALCNLPFVGMVVVDNQYPFAKGVSTLWNLPVFESNNLQEEAVVSAIKKVSELKKLGFRFQPTLDGRGAERILQAILNECERVIHS